MSLRKTGAEGATAIEAINQGASTEVDLGSKRLPRMTGCGEGIYFRGRTWRLDFTSLARRALPAARRR